MKDVGKCDSAPARTRTPAPGLRRGAAPDAARCRRPYTGHGCTRLTKDRLPVGLRVLAIQHRLVVGFRRRYAGPPARAVWRSNELSGAMRAFVTMCLVTAVAAASLTACSAQTAQRDARRDQAKRDPLPEGRDESVQGRGQSQSGNARPPADPPSRDEPAILFDDARWTNDARQPRGVPWADPKQPKERRRWPLESP
jgi:hypothetical protein